jgi:hypothetical protein
MSLVIQQIYKFPEQSQEEHTKSKGVKMSEKNRLSLDDLIALPNVQEEEVFIPQWNKSILVRGISKATQVKLGRLLQDDNKDAFDYQKALLKESVVDPKLDDDAIDILYQKESTIVDLIFVKLNEINGLGGIGTDAEEFPEE